MNQPERHNAFGRWMRDALCEALDIALVDGSIERIHLAGRGPSFCSGGDLDEFGTQRDLATGHAIRLDRSVGKRLSVLSDRVVVELHGACIGAGIELPAFAGEVKAHSGTWFQLPELAMGLIPGAGGTVSLPRRIGRWRTAWMALSGSRLELDAALEWGLVDGRVDA
jgi:enoyl-CoA hydratase/carnithine racemase